MLIKNLKKSNPSEEKDNSDIDSKEAVFHLFYHLIILRIRIKFCFDHNMKRFIHITI